MKLLKIKVGVLLVIFLANFSAPVFALSDEELAEMRVNLRNTIMANNAAYCKKTLEPAFTFETQQFLKFLEQNFQNKSSNSSLVNIAISRYAEYKLSMKEWLSYVAPGQKNLIEETRGAVREYESARPIFENYGDETVIDAELAAYSDCKKLMDEQLQSTKDMLITHIKKTTAQKKTAIMQEKYHAINEKLRELNIKIAKVYGYLMAFAKKLSSFTDPCVQK